jgi:Ca-activated chloride channel family protein
MGFIDWTSLLWLLLLVPVIILLYLLKLKRRPLVVSSVLLWSRLLKDVQANAPFQKLRRNLLLLLQLLIVCLGILALARPFYRADSLGGKNVVLILDGSASMKSRDAGGTRFEAARSTALRMVDSMQGGDAMMPLLVTSRTYRLAPFTTDRAHLRRALMAAEPRDTITDLREAIVMATSIAGSAAARSGNQIYVLSDGAVGDLDEIDTRGSEVQFVRFGSRANNVGIVAFDARRLLSAEGGYQGFIAIRNYGNDPVACNLELYRDDNLFDVRPISLPAADLERGFSEQTLVLNGLAPRAGILRAHLDCRDDLDSDNEAYAQLSARRETRVLLVTGGNIFLEKAIQTDPDVRLSVVAANGYTGQPGYDVVVFDSVSPQRVGPANYFYINAGGPTCPADLERRIGESSVTDWSRTHPVLRYVSLNQLDIRQAWKAAIKPWGQELAAHAEGPLIIAGERQEMPVADQRLTFRSLYIGFSLLDSDFWERVGFPIFINNAIQWLAARPGQGESQRLKTGETAVVGLPEGVRAATVTDPRGRRHVVPAEGPVLFFRDTEDAGVYLVEGPNRFRARFTANLLSRDESDTRPRDKLQFGRRPVLAAGPGRRTNQEFWRWLALLALAVLGIEWYVYHRRV